MGGLSSMIAVFVDGEPWRRVDDLRVAGPDEPVFAVDPGTGRIRFGDGRHGRIPPAGAVVQLEYRRGGPSRLRYFAGRVLSAEDLADEQEYLLERLRRHNRRLHGWGVVDGLEIGVEDGAEICISPGCAIDACGNDIVVERELRVPTPAPGARSHEIAVRLIHAERPVDPVPAPWPDGVQPSRVAESVALRLGGREGEGIAIGRLVWTHGRWCVDATFAPRPLGPDDPGTARK
jgi:hypothetical protein